MAALFANMIMIQLMKKGGTVANRTVFLPNFVNNQAANGQDAKAPSIRIEAIQAPSPLDTWTRASSASIFGNDGEDQP